jgi:hypothetical protein
MNHPASQQDRDEVVESILGLVRNDVRDLIYAGKDPEAVAELLTHTLGSMRSLAHRLTQSTAPKLTAADVSEVRAVLALIPEDVRLLFNAGVLAGAHPLSYARRLENMIAEATLSE